MSCPNQVSIPFEPGKVVHFPPSECAICPLRSDCTNSKRGRSVSIHPDEALMQELRARQSTASGRLDLRRRTTVEHYASPYWSLAGGLCQVSWTTEKSL
jgi:hypothetical protein